MTEITDETIEKIANAVRNNRISNTWKDPKKAQMWGTLGWAIAAYAIIISIAVFLVTDVSSNYSEEINDDFRNIALQNMNCAALKQTLLDLESDESEKANWDVEKQIIARCLK